ncbi:hypothetical protein GPZ77_34320 (plasmid) [Streptomyces sp. QHH-9511]|uniref:hypothetical protein n=1 Tax=Streptomyces sp. QHH-9511 TaxID=2684468 RepID=UPI001315B35F|nr:hypothetical protein [Streptomyces sp. QHH-9511]QGZ53308.1 hypothetical protein GPZ77_34320 [Streptomyces sp. QHH-9511]
MFAKSRGPVVYTLFVLVGGIACISWETPIWATALIAVVMMLIADQLERALRRGHGAPRRTVRR